MPDARRKARILALQVLYEVDCSSHPWEPTLERALDEAPLKKEGEALARTLVACVMEHRAAADEQIAKYAPQYPVSQLSAVDRNILRIAVCEISFNNTPPKVAINEAVEIAKSFGSDNLHRFVNGVLGSVMAAANP